MSREIRAQASTKQLRKAKILDSFRQPSKNRIMLTDLCPEQKAKIGDLVRTLQVRKSENQNLEQKILQMNNREKNYVERIEELQQKIEKYEKMEARLKEEINLSKMKENEKDKYIEHLLAEKSEKAKQVQKKTSRVDQYTVTQAVVTVNQSVQFSLRKKKCKEKETQTQFSQTYKKYSNNSQSFEKIMNRGRTQSHSIGKDKIKERHGLEELGDQEGYHFKDNSFNIKKQTQHSIGYEDNDDDFNELAKKWLQLKERNMQKIKQSYKKSKQRQSSKQKSRKEMKKNPLPGQFDDRNVDELEEDSPVPNLNIQNNESFGPKKTNKVEAGQEFDDIELNRILKSKNFSASRLLLKNRQNSQESERNSGCEKQAEQKWNKRVGKAHQFQNTSNMKMSSASNSRSQHNIDFYQTDLLDIVSSINRN